MFWYLCAAGNGKSSLHVSRSSSVKTAPVSSTAARKLPKADTSKGGKTNPRAVSNGDTNKTANTATQTATSTPPPATSSQQTKATGNNNGASSKSPAASSKPAEAVAAIPDKGSDRSIVMPSTAAAQADSGVPVVNAESAAAVRADRLVSGMSSSLLSPVPVAGAPTVYCPVGACQQ